MRVVRLAQAPGSNLHYTVTVEALDTDFAVLSRALFA